MLCLSPQCISWRSGVGRWEQWVGVGRGGGACSPNRGGRCWRRLVLEQGGWGAPSAWVGSWISSARMTGNNAQWLERRRARAHGEDAWWLKKANMCLSSILHGRLPIAKAPMATCSPSPSPMAVCRGRLCLQSTYVTHRQGLHGRPQSTTLLHGRLPRSLAPPVVIPGFKT
jgi:hypothetical protein